MAQYSFVKSAGGLLVPFGPESKKYLQSLKFGAVLYGDFKQARNPAFHRKYFSLLNLGYHYWQPTGGTISPADKALVNGYVKYLVYYAGCGDEALTAAADGYLKEVSQDRAENISITKSFEAFRAWVTIEAGFYVAFHMPDGSIRKEPKSISFAKMDDIEFAELYKATIDVLWNFILYRTFPNPQAAENAASQLLDYAS